MGRGQNAVKVLWIQQVSTVKWDVNYEGDEVQWKQGKINRLDVPCCVKLLFKRE